MHFGYENKGDKILFRLKTFFFTLTAHSVKPILFMIYGKMLNDIRPLKSILSI